MFSIWLGWWNNVSNPSAKWRGRWWARLWVRRLSVPQWDIIMTSVEVHLLKRLNTIVRRVLSCQMNILLSLISASALWSVFTLQIKCYCINFAPSKKKITKIILKKVFFYFLTMCNWRNRESLINFRLKSLVRRTYFIAWFLLKWIWRLDCWVLSVILAVQCFKQDPTCRCDIGRSDIHQDLYCRKQEPFTEKLAIMKFRWRKIHVGILVVFIRVNEGLRQECGLFADIFKVMI